MMLVNYPKISIITPTYNQGQYIEQTILSILNQRYPCLEYIIIDGGSTDQTVEIIRKYEKSLSYWISEKDDGMYEALQKGFKKCNGDIMMWINSDDILLKDSLFNIARIFNEFPHIGWITGLNSYLNENGEITGSHASRNFSVYDFLMHDYKWIQQESTVWRRSLWIEAGDYIANKKLAGDLELWNRFINISTLYPCDIPIGGFRRRSFNQLSHDQTGYDEEARHILCEKTAISIHLKIVIFFIQGIRFIKRGIYNKAKFKFIFKLLHAIEGLILKHHYRRILFNKDNNTFLIVSNSY